jgi:hypothetical protein
LAPDLGGFDKGDRPSAVTSLAAANSAMAASAIALSASLAPKIRAATRARPILVPLAAVTMCTIHWPNVMPARASSDSPRAPRAVGLAGDICVNGGWPGM